jgi:bile acid:Na+ symporter, BASS family
VLGIGSSWEQIVSLLGQQDAPGSSGVHRAVGGRWRVLATGPTIRRTTLAGIAPLRNAGPAFAAVAIAFDSDPEILAALSGILLVGLVLASQRQPVWPRPDRQPASARRARDLR